MASINSISSSSINDIYSSKRITGLASGLDTDEMVKGMTLATRTKIAKQKQQKQLVEWKISDMREISSKLISFQSKYSSYSSSTNLRNTNFYEKNSVSTSGENSKYISVSGSSKSAESLSISAVKQLATDTSYISSNGVSSQKLSSGEVTGTKEFTKSSLEGSTISLSYGNKTFNLTLSSNREYNNASDVVEAINDALKKQDFGVGETANDRIKASLEGDKIVIGYASDKIASYGNSIKIKGGSKELLGALGMSAGDTASGDGSSIKGNKAVTEDSLKGLTSQKSLADLISGGSITFNYNGSTKEVKMPSLDNKEVFTTTTGSDGKEKTEVNMEKLAKYLENELADGFGSGRVKVSYENDKLSFQTLKAGSNEADTSSVLRVSKGSNDVLKALGFEEGDSNRANLNTSLGKSGIITKNSAANYKLGKDDYAINIKNNNTGEIVTINKTVDGVAFDENTKVSDIIKAINQSGAKVNVSYSEISDKFTLTSKEPGASGDFAIVGKLDESGNVATDDGSYNLGQAIFGKNVGTGTGVQNDYSYSKGQDAIIMVDYDGSGGMDPVEITRSSNSFDVDGLAVTVNNTFGIKEDGSIDKEAAVKFTSKVDSEKVFDTIKSMIEDYNSIIEISYEKMSEKRNRDYSPLTDEQKEEMTDKQIEQWEEKAKAGMLFNDPDLRSFTNEISGIFSGSAETIKRLSDMGITTSTSYSDNGKVVLDEDKLKAAIEANPESVKDVFTAEAGKTTENGYYSLKGGIMTQVYDVFEKYAATTGNTKGIFVEKAGAKEAPLSMLKNTWQSEITSIDDFVKTLQTKLESETERAYDRFTSLETFISQMNSQSQWLSQQFTY